MASTHRRSAAHPLDSHSDRRRLELREGPEGQGDEEGAKSNAPGANIEPTVTAESIIDQTSSQGAGGHAQTAGHRRSPDDGSHHPQREILARQHGVEGMTPA